MASQQQDNHGTGGYLGHFGAQWPDLSSEKRKEEPAATRCEALDNHEPLQSEKALFAQSGTQHGEASGATENACANKDDLMSSQLEEPTYNAEPRRSISPDTNSGPNKRPCRDPATPRERPSRSYHIASAGYVNQEQEPSGMRLVNIFPGYEGLHNHEFQFKATTAGLYTPTSTMEYGYASQRIDPYARSQYSTHNLNHDRLGSPPPSMLEPNESTPNQAQDDSANDRQWPSLSDSNDEYPVDSENENDMLQLLDSAEACIETHIPPSSVLYRWDRDSRSADVYDPNLQHSPPQPPAILDDETEQSHKAIEDDNLLDEDVDWDAVYAISATIPKNTSLAGSQEREEPSAEVEVPTREQQTHCDKSEDRIGPLAPFMRSRFPGKVHDRSVLQMLSSEVMLRTCFRTEELIEQAAHCYNHHQEVVFELYAKVESSNREDVGRQQYFLLVDLFEDLEPRLFGTLSKWKPGSLKDRHSQEFVEITSHKLCRCMCKAKRGSKTEIGWVLDILDIRESDWDEIQRAKIQRAKMIIGEDNGKGADE
ncbi:hypothetical protein PG993_005279 [Apiospora rasikravindrae]|uniref:Uncharacterized protein n=1 Tax=Apiospora rasikravindrae TaxID=990691 RepID=A0ABR1TF55_9PEZI